MVEILMVVTIIVFIAGALVVAARGVMVRAKRLATLSLIHKINTACAEFRDDFGYYPPDDSPITNDLWCYSSDYPIRTTDNPSGISLKMNGNLVLRLCYLRPKGQKQYLDFKRSDLRGTITRNYAQPTSAYAANRFEYAYPEPAEVPINPDLPVKGQVVVDAWGRPLYYDCHTGDPTRPTVADYRWSVAGVAAASVPIRNAKGADIFSCGSDGLTAPNNRIDDNQNQSVDESTEWTLIGEADDDINNWGSQ
jgi:type II secretory pathway pseudopilin PulG